MSIAFYNTLTRAVEPFTPLQPGKVTMYTCGPTVYNYFHIGNARSFVMADVIRRYFQYRGYEVAFVMNITDIDDRIIQQSIDEHIPASDVARKYTEAFFEDLSRFGIQPADVHPRATENIEGIVRHIDGLVHNGAAYELEGDVYYAVESFPGYGKLSGKRLEDLMAGARVGADERKRHPGDFALWKAAKPGEPSWESPWGPGRPGWHIECSVMSQKHLGDSFDIHAGGNDLIFPHHENEIAQSEALTHTQLARYWIHFGFLNIDNEKMSKSLGNFFTAREILDVYPVEAVRFFYLQTHYRGPLNFSSDGLDASKKGLQKLQALYDMAREEAGGDAELDVDAYEQRFIEAVDQEFNTPAGLGVLFELVRDANAAAQHGGLDAATRGKLAAFLRRTAGGVFGILSEEARATRTAADAAPFIELLIDARAQARAAKMWALSDFIRDGLKERGILLDDGKSGTTWRQAE
jgi:cysteinyl-tRNA synthetase